MTKTTLDAALAKDVLTTGQAAAICGVAPRTICKWVDAGTLVGYRIPGSKDRRIQKRRLVEFMRQNGIPMPMESEPMGGK